jgi:hypothetical protein
MSARLYIAIPVHNRLRIAGQCIPTVLDGISPEDSLVIYDDGSTPGVYSSDLIDSKWLVQTKPSIGIDAQRQKHFAEFWGNREIHGCTHLYLCDADAPHDPNWRAHALDLQARYNAPICLYRTKTHSDYQNNVYHDEPTEDVIWQRFSPGVSLLLDMRMVEKVMQFMPEKLTAWDWVVPSILGYRMAVSRVSYCDHVGIGGQHDPADGSVGDERATNPTPWLVEKRKEILSALCPPTS